MRISRLLPLPVLLSLCVASYGEVEQLLKHGNFEFPPVTKRVPRSAGGDPTKQPIDRDWMMFKDSAEGEGGKLIVGLTNEIAHSGKQSIFVHFDKVTKKSASALLASEMIPIQPGQPYKFTIWGRVDKENPVALDTRVPYLKLRVDWFKKVKASTPLAVEGETEEPADDADDEKASDAKKPDEAKKAVEEKKPVPDKVKAVAPVKAGAGDKAAEAKKVEPGKKEEAEAAEPEDDEEELRQTGNAEWRYQPMPGAKPVPGIPTRAPFFNAREWKMYYADLTAPADAQYVKVTWFWDTSSEEGETNGVMYFDTATIEGEPGPKEDRFADDPELKKQLEAEKNDPDFVQPDEPATPVKRIPVVPIAPKPAPAPDAPKPDKAR